MSVIGEYARLDPEDLEQCRSNPDWLHALWEKKIASAEVLEVDKAWDAIGWLLAHVVAPTPEHQPVGAGFQLIRSPAALVTGEGGTTEPFLRSTYGPAKSLSVEQVSTLSHWLGNVSSNALRQAYDGKAMNTENVYPQIWFQEGPRAFEEYLLPYFESLRAFVARAAEAKQPILVFFS
jgi:hypothetical protein